MAVARLRDYRGSRPMGASIIFHRETAGGVDLAAARELRISKYRQGLMHAYCTAGGGIAGDVIGPGLGLC
jgi:hypothetical protein